MKQVNDPALEQIMLRDRPWCELPDEKGNPVCQRPSAMILTMRSQYTVAVCKECADYVKREGVLA